MAVSLSSSNPTAPVCNWVLPTVPSPGTLIPSARPKTIIKQSSDDVGAFWNIIWLLLISYADSASCTTPARDTKREYHEPG